MLVFGLDLLQVPDAGVKLIDLSLDQEVKRGLIDIVVESLVLDKVMDLLVKSLLNKSLDNNVINENLAHRLQEVVP